MATTHTILTADVIAKEALMQLANNMVMGSRVHRGYEKEFSSTVNGYKKGDSIRIKKPNKFKVTKSRVRVTTAMSERSITLQVATQAHVSWPFETHELTQDIVEYSENYIQPGCAALANQVDLDLCGLYADVWNEVYESTGFVTPESFIVLGKAAQLLDEEAVPGEDRCIVLNPAANWSLANALKNMYVTDVSKGALKKGYLAKIANFEIFMDQNIRTHDTGDYHNTGSSPAILVGLTGGTLMPSTDGGTLNTHIQLIDVKYVASEALRTGDIFTIAGVYAVNPMSGESTGSLRKFVVTADASCPVTETTSGGGVDVHFEPEMIATGAYKTIDTFPVTAAAVTIIGNEGEPYPQNMAFHKNAFALVMVPLEMPDSTWGARVTHNGLSIRVVKFYDGDEDVETCRLDILYGVKTLYPELATRIFGAEG